jgi:hypothetical protein
MRTAASNPLAQMHIAVQPLPALGVVRVLFSFHTPIQHNDRCAVWLCGFAGEVAEPIAECEGLQYFCMGVFHFFTPKSAAIPIRHTIKNPAIDFTYRQGWATAIANRPTPMKKI